MSLYTEVDFANSLLLHPPHSNCFLLSLLTPFSHPLLLSSTLFLFLFYPSFRLTFLFSIISSGYPISLPLFPPSLCITWFLFFLPSLPFISSPLSPHSFCWSGGKRSLIREREEGGGGGLRRRNEKREREPDGGKRMKIKWGTRMRRKGRREREKEGRGGKVTLASGHSSSSSLLSTSLYYSSSFPSSFFS